MKQTTTVPETTAAKPEKIVGLSPRCTYAMGETLTAEALKLNVVYESGREEQVLEGVSCVPEKLDQAGTQEITVTYGEITQTFEVEVLDFFEFETEIQNNSGEDYNLNQNVGWVLYVAARYEGNYAEPSVTNDLGVTEFFSGSFSTEWKNAVSGNASFWNYSREEYGYGEYHAGGAFTLPDDPAFAGDYSVSVTFGDLTKTVTFTLVYNGDYETGTGWSVENVNWN